VVSFWAGEDCVAEAKALFFHLIEEAACPDVLGCEDAETDHDCEPAWTGRENHDQANGEQGESEEDLQKAFGLLKSFDHISAFLSQRLGLCVGAAQAYWLLDADGIFRAQD
jgi:hypothetical protein